MAQWKIRQTVDLAASGSGPTAWSEALMTDGDKHAHTWAVTVLDNGRAADLSGTTAICYFNRADHTTVAVKGTINGNLVSVTLTQECYAIEGPLVGIFRLTATDGTRLTLSVLRFNVGKGPNGAIVDPGHLLPNLEDLLANVEKMEQATTAANQAATRANEAAKAATEAAENFDTSGLADGLKYDESTGNLQLTSGGETIPGAKVTIKLTDSYTKAEVDAKFQGFEQSLGNLDIQGMTYYATYGTETLENGEEAENVFTLWEVDKDGNESVKSRFVIQGGGGGGGTVATNLKVERVTQSPFIGTPTDDPWLEWIYSSTDSDGELIDGTYQMKLGTTVIASGPCIHGLNAVRVKDYVNTGTQKFVLTVTDEGGSVAVKSWTVQIIDVRMESTFRDSITYPAGQAVRFPYTPYGSITKTVHFKLDGVELDPATVTTSGILQSYTLPAQEHGAHLLESWITAQVNTVTVETEHLYYDIVWWDEDSSVPVIGCIYRYDHYGKVAAKQYNTTPIPLYVFDPSTASPVITKTVDGALTATETLTGSSTVWAYKTSDVGDHTLVVSCGDTSVTIIMDIVELGINVQPITADLAFDFDPTSLSNSSADRLWRDPDTGVAMAVSNNFDWINGGYRLDDNGNQYFCVKAGTRAIIDHKLFAQDASINGAEFKLVYKVTNVRRVDATFLSCVAGETPVGLRMDAHAAYLMTSATGDSPLYMPYSENDVIEFEVNIGALDQEDTTATAVIMSYEDGVAYRPLIYDGSHRLYQYSAEATPITIGSDDCDVWVYRLKAYTTALSDADILSNFIADSRDAETMIARYERNQITDENNAVTPESVAKSHPNLRVIKLDAPYFTQDKNEMIKDTTVECISYARRAVWDNWRATNCYHSGQGTTSNEYGFAARNLNVYMCFDGVYQHKRVTYDEAYITKIVFGDGTTISDGSGRVSLTDNSVPNGILNIKVNVASSEQANNALLAKRFHQFLPYTPVSVRRDPRCKTTMEFQPCVVFIRENNEDLSTHREFADTGWHFYSIGNIGDSKETDQTRTNDPSDHNEWCVEIKDNTFPNSTFPTGVIDGNGKQVYPITEAQWCAGNPAYDSLHNDWGATFEFRYTHPDITDDEEAAAIATFNAFYKWVVTATDEQFVSEMTNWFVEGAPEYMYLFTERYTMLDNRAKNTFWHWGKTYISAAEATAMGPEKSAWFTVDDAAAAINNGYRMDFWDYDNDTSLGINNTGEMTQPAGKEDVDYRTDGDPNSGYIYNAAESTFFCRVRDLMYPQLAAMYLSRETAGAWSAESLIAEFDAWQAEYSEELWRLHIERVYHRTYEAGTRRFLEDMLNGRKKYQRRQWERDQETYMGTKYVSAKVKADQIMFRCNTPQSAVVAPNYNLDIVPYSDMYVSVMYGNSDPIRIRAKAGREYQITNPLTGVMDDTAVLIYCASRIQAINDLSGAYIHDNDFSKAEKLQTLIIGNATPGYSNSFLTALNIGNNPLLETLDVRGCPNLTGSLNLTACGNLQTLLAQGTALKGVTFAPSGAIRSAYLPSTVNTLVMRSLHYLTDLQMSYDSLESLTEEYSVVDELAIVQDAADTLQTVRLAGIDWVLDDTSLLNTILAMDNTSLIGKVHINDPVRQQEYYMWSQAWPDLQVTYNSLVSQYPVTTVDWDGKVLHVQYVDRNGTAIDPVAAGLIPVPTRESSKSTNYTYDGLDGVLTNITSARTLTVKYAESVRQYTIRWHGYPVSKVEQETLYDYGADAMYSGECPTRTDEEDYLVYHQFVDWDKSTGFVDQDLDVYPIWERGDLPNVGVDTETLNATQIYAIKRNNAAQDYFQHKDRVLIPMGYQPEFTNVEHVDLADEMTFDGATYVDTGIKLFAGGIADAWTLVADMTYTQETADACMLSCMQDDGYMGFKVKYVNGVSVQWSTNSLGTASVTDREIVVLRHEAGSRNLKVYASWPAEMQIGYTELTKLIDTVTDATLVVGAAKSDAGEYYDYATGKLHSCRIWYGDLGETVCRKIAKWPREVYRAEAGTFGAYKLASNSAQKTQIDFIFASLLSRYHRMNPTGSNAGGFEASEMYAYLITRVLPAFPEIWQRMMEECTINCMQYVDGTNHSISSMKAQIWLPSYIEMLGGTNEPWVYEGAGHILFFINNTTRVKFKGPDSFPRDGYNVFSTADDPTLNTANAIVDGDIWLDTNDINRAYLRKDGKWLVAYVFWLRGAAVNNSEHFCYVSYYGSVGNLGFSAYGAYGVCPRFSI